MDLLVDLNCGGRFIFSLSPSRYLHSGFTWGDRNNLHRSDHADLVDFQDKERPIQYSQTSRFRRKCHASDIVDDCAPSSLSCGA